MSSARSKIYPIPFIPKMSSAGNDEKTIVKILTGNKSLPPKSNMETTQQLLQLKVQEQQSKAKQQQQQPVSINVSGAMDDLIKNTHTLINKEMVSMEDRLTNSLLGKIGDMLKKCPPGGQQPVLVGGGESSKVTSPGDRNVAPATDRPNLKDHNDVQASDPNNSHNTVLNTVGTDVTKKRGRRDSSRSPSRGYSYSRGKSDSRSYSRSPRRRRSRSRSRDRHSRHHRHSGSGRSGRSSMSGRRLSYRSRSRSPSNHRRNRSPSQTETAPSAKEDDGKVSLAAPGVNALLDASQAVWHEKVQRYNAEVVWGPEVNSALAGASKTFWQQPPPEDRQTELTSSGLVPSNCPFLRVRKANAEIFSATATNIRTSDVELQEVQKKNVSMASCLVQALDMLEQDPPSVPDIRDKIIDALQIAGHNNSGIEQHRRNAFKVSLPAEKKSLASMAVNPDDEFLFGDNLESSVEEIKKKNKLKKEFVAVPTARLGTSGGNKLGGSGPRTDKQSGNDRSCQKTRGSSTHVAGNDQRKAGEKRGRDDYKENRPNKHNKYNKHKKYPNNKKKN